ncbi:MAG: pilus assembly protein PilM [Alphaproteobacteria bacterium]|nr:pilus assembly protein PilM [Alphaproteobacteria bacterium]
MFDSSFLCLDIGNSGVRGIAHRVRNAELAKSAYYSIDSFDTVYALKSVIDELDRQIGTHFDTAYITGDFGIACFKMAAKSTIWQTEHKISPLDIQNQLSQIEIPDGFYPMHIIPLRYDTPKLRNMLSPIGHSDTQLISAFSEILFDRESMENMMSNLRRAHIQSHGFYAPHFLQSKTFRQKKQTAMFIDFGAETTTVSIWTDRGPVWYNGFAIAGNDLSQEISDKFEISFSEAERIKKNVANMTPKDTERFLPADLNYAFSRAEVNDLVFSFFHNLIQDIKTNGDEYITKYKPSQIIISGGGSKIEGLDTIINELFEIPVINKGVDANVRALSDFIWTGQEAHRRAFHAYAQSLHRKADKILRIFKIFKPKKKNVVRFIPIMPSTLCFNMALPETYSLFKSGGISAIHVDIMDGLYVDKIAGGIDELRAIRAAWNGHLHVHLMTEAPSAWAASAITAGADTIILSTNTSGLRMAIQNVKQAGKRVGIALNPESSISLLKTVLRDLDEVMIMAVTPGAAGQQFDKNILQKISALVATRKKYGLKYKISVDGGITPETAKLCWDAGADLLVSGSYLGTAPDFPLAVQSLLNH